MLLLIALYSSYCCADVCIVGRWRLFSASSRFMGTVLAFFVLGEQPSAWDLGAIGVVAGLVLVVRDPKGDGAAPPFSSRV